MAGVMVTCLIKGIFVDRACHNRMDLTIQGHICGLDDVFICRFASHGTDLGFLQPVHLNIIQIEKVYPSRFEAPL